MAATETKTEQQIRVFLNVHRSTPLADLVPLAERVAATRGWHGAVRANFIAAVKYAVDAQMLESLGRLRAQFGK